MHVGLPATHHGSVIQPAMARIRQWPVFAGIDGGLWALAWLSVLIGVMVVHDLRMDRRVHPTTLMGGGFFLGSRVIALHVLAPSELGLTFVRRLIG